MDRTLKKKDITEIPPEEDFETLLNQGMSDPMVFSPGDKVEAVITQITKEWTFIDLGGKSDGYISTNEFVDPEGELTIERGDMVNAYFLPSMKHRMLFTIRLTVETMETSHLEEVYNSGIPLEGRVEKEIKGGFAIKIGEDIHVFCPYSQMGIHRVEDTTQCVGQKLTFKIIEYGKGGRNVIVSRRAILEEERRELKNALRQSLKEGMTVSGNITSIETFGAFVDIGGLEGLIPISEISWGRVEDINSLLTVGQEIDVVAKELDWENDKFAFSLKETEADPWENVATKYPEGSFHKGIVARLAPFGAFVTLEPGVDGLLHISELGKEKRINHPREVLEEKQAIDIKISRVDERQRRLSLEMASKNQGVENIDYYKKHIAGGNKESSGAMGSLGDILRAQLDEKKGGGE